MSGETDEQPTTTGDTTTGTAGERLTWDDLGTPGEKMAMGEPPFGYRIEVPPGWKVLRAGEHARDDVERACTATPGWANLAPAQQVGLRQLLTSITTQAELSGVVLTAADAGVDKSTGELLMGSLTLAWVRTAPIEADTALAEVMAEGGREVRQFAGDHSIAVLQCGVADTGTEVIEGTGRTAYQVQAFVPTPGTAWMAVVTGTTPQQRMAPLMEAATQRMAQSLRLVPTETGN